MNSKIRACKWGINVFYNGVSAYSARDISWKLYKTTGDGMRNRGDNLNLNDGNSIYRLCITMRTDVVLRSNSYNKLNISNTICRGGYSTMGMRGI